jgi:hypothetical protein
MVDFPVFVMLNCYSIGLVALFQEQSDPNGIRTRVTAVKGRCPGPLDDRVTKAGQYRNCYSLTQGKLPNCFQALGLGAIERGAPAFGRRGYSLVFSS